MLDSSNTKDIWQQLLDELKTSPVFFRVLFEVHLADTYLLRQQNDLLVVAVPNEHSRAWIEDRARDTIERTLIGIAGHPVQVQFQTRRHYNERSS